MVDEEHNRPPPPPEEESGGYESEGYTPEPQHVESEGVSEATGPAVASSANKNLILMVVGGLLGLFLLYQIFSGGDEEVAVAAPPSVQMGGGADVAPISSIPLPTAPIVAPPLPPPPPLVQPDEPLPLPPPPPETPDIDFIGDGPVNEELQARRASEMLIVNNASDGRPTEQTDETKSTAERAVATHVGDLDKLVLQGKVIDAVLETALDTTLQGPLRGIVARDVYAESGYGVLIPKGSRIIGTYNTDTVRGQGRVFIIWSRLIRPDGVDIQLNSQAIDRLGRSGMPGHVDDRYFEIFGGAILTSILGITLAGISDAILDPEESTSTQGTDGSTTTTGSSVDTAISGAVESIGGVSQQVVGGMLDARPSITVDQGTPLKVFVNRDLEFPDEVTGEGTSGVRIIQ